MLTQRDKDVRLPPGRTEDKRLLRGCGRFVADIELPQQLAACLHRSPHAHARICRIDVTPALKLPGIKAVYTAVDLDAAGITDMPRTKMWMDTSPPIPSRPILARDTVRFVGEGIALVVGVSPELAREAAELIDVEFEPLSPLTNMREASEFCFDWEAGDRKAVDHAFSNAFHTTSFETVFNRIAVSPLETRAAIGEYNSKYGFRLHVQSQGVHHIRNVLADTVLGISRDQLQVLTDDVGGAFGMKVSAFPEYALVLHAARQLGLPVKWVSSRTEAFLSDTHGRDQIVQADVAFDNNGRIVGLQASNLSSMGAYVTGDGPEMATNQFAKVFGHTYAVPALHVRVRGVCTNMTPIAAYRGYGKPEAISVVERLLDRAAIEMDIDRIELRRRNLISESSMPYTNLLGKTYDSGAFEHVMDSVLKQADWDRFSARRAESEAQGKRRGIGVGLCLQMTMGLSKEESEVSLSADGMVIVKTSMQACGQGHETTYAQVVSERLGISMSAVRVEQGDSRHLPDGIGTGASTGLTIGGSSIFRATEMLIENCMPHVAEHMEVAVDDIVFGEGQFSVTGTDRHIGLFEFAKNFAADNVLVNSNPCISRIKLESNLESTPNGAYVAEVEVDPETGEITLIAVTAVNDLGQVINPSIAEGQIHGGVAQGVGQAMFEDVIYDTVTGQLLTGSFMDYCLPRARDLPTLVAVSEGIPTKNNPLGSKGAGEIGVIGSLAPILNAVADAIGNDEFDMPMLSECIWLRLRAQDHVG